MLITIPGSPSLLYDGLPLVGRLEFAGLIILITLTFTRNARQALGKAISSSDRHSLVVFLLFLLIFLKLFTFFRFPIGDHFEVCIKSAFRPTNEVCEKSFDNIFHSNDGVNAQGDITRIDRHINFKTTSDNENSTLGASHSTWNLPFQNDFPRFSELWMDRLPFSALIGAVIDQPQESLLPIEYVGKVVVSGAFDEVRASEFESRRLLLIPIKAGRQELRLNYQFFDDESVDVPDVPPTPMGPYAHLIIGKPFNPESASNLRLFSRGYVVNLKDSRTVTQIVARSSSQLIVAESEERPDVAKLFDNQQLINSGFRFEIPITDSLGDLENLEIFAVLSDGTESPVGRISFPKTSTQNFEPRNEMFAKSSMTSDFKSWFRLGENYPLLAADHRTVPPLLATLLLNALDITSLLLFVAVPLLLLLASLRGKFRQFLIVLLATFIVNLLIWLILKFANITLFQAAPSPLLVGLVITFPAMWLIAGKKEFINFYCVVTSLSTGCLLAIADFRAFTGLRQSDWWGFMIFRDRAMDWYVFQGYAYQILVQQSLRAGENLFYFMPGSRYVIFVQHLIFGNNDVLIGILSLASLIAATLWTITFLAKSLTAHPIALIATVTLAITLLTLNLNSLSSQLAIYSSSETFAWILMLLFVPLATNYHSNRRLFVMGFMLGCIVFLRPNYLMIGICLVSGFVLLLPHFKPQTTLKLLLGRLWVCFGFALSTSLALFHNVYFAESFNFFTARTDPRQTVFEPIRILSFWSDSEVRSIMFAKFQNFLYWHELTWSDFQIASWITQLLFVTSVIYLIRNRQAFLSRAVLLFAAPSYILSAAPFGIMTIPERQFNAATITLGITSVFSLVIVSLSDEKETVRL